MKILLTGGSGLLGKELLKLNPNIIAPSHESLDICNQSHTIESILSIKPDIIIHAAALTDDRIVNKEQEKALTTNIIGTTNVSIAALRSGARLVYLSTDYIYKGDRGNYKETDEILPFNLYSWTKLGGECSVKAVKNHLIIRTSFGDTFNYKQAFTDKYTSKDYVETLAPMILEAAISPLTGVLNLGTERKSLYNYAYKTKNDVIPVRIDETPFTTPIDTSMNLQKWQDFKQLTPVAKSHDHCRACGSDNLKKYLDLGLMPMANNLEFTSQRAKEKERFPLQVMFCDECGLSQLSVVVDPSKMFSYYTYRSAINGGYVNHCKKMAAELMISANDFVIDIAGNDGTLLKQFKDITGCRVLNVDPATNLTAIAEQQGVPSLTEFWNKETAERILFNHGEADFITATNVFAHVDNIKDFLLGAKIALSNEGLLILEFPYLVDFIENNEFDTVYFEHLSYVSLMPIIRLASECGLNVVDVSKHNIHGGTIRVYIAKQTSRHRATENVEMMVQNEIKGGYNKFKTYEKWSETVSNIITDFGSELLFLKKQGYKIGAFAASAKGNTLLNSACITTDLIDFIADETPEKIGKYSPGTGIPIVHKDYIKNANPDYIVILSWNFKEEIIEKLKKITDAKFIIPIPSFRII